MPDYRTQSQIRRDAKREANEKAKVAAETKRRNQGIIDTKLAVRSLFPEMPARQLGQYYLVHAAHHRLTLDATLETWMRLWNRSRGAHDTAVAAGDTVAAALALDEAEQIYGIADQLVKAFAREEERRSIEAEAA